ncbi:DUF5641 domain-containing protein [Trichonephila clavipes]|nr:DUF5641 domain-containing protein [Trichonephila clavipes]
MCIEPGDYGTGDGVPRQTRLLRAKYYCLQKQRKVSIIQELTESDFWKHVNSENNAADILSRGISPDKIQHCELWWFGPPFLHQYKELEPYDITAVEGDDLFLQELKETSEFPLCALLKNFEPLDIIIQIEAVLSYRLICPLSNDPNDVETLTPAHFLVGSSLVAVLDPDNTEIPMNRYLTTFGELFEKRKLKTAAL